MTTEKTWKVYKLTSPTGRVYIGCTSLPAWQRFQNGRGYSKNKELYEDILQFGWNNFTKKVIAEYAYEDEELARRKEHLEIQRYFEENGDLSYNQYRGGEQKESVGKGTPPKAVICVESGIKYPSAYQASKETGIPKNKILEMCNGKIRSYHKTHWKFL